MPEIVDIAKLFASGQLKFKKGSIEFLTQDVILVPVDWVVTMHKKLEKSNSENFIYYTAKEMGIRWFKGLYQSYKISAEDVIKWGINTLGVAGWGITSAPEINLKDKICTFILEEAAESKAFGRVGYATDHFVRGSFASGAKVLFGGECDAVELTCMSEGAPFCKFLAQPTDHFDKKDPRVVRQLKPPKNVTII